MRQTILGGLAAVIIVITAPVLSATQPLRSGHPVFDRVVELVMEKFHSASALDRFAEAVQEEVRDPAAPVTAESPYARVEEAIGTVLASLQASHTGHYTPASIDYFELADIFRYAIRKERERLFPPEGRVHYPGIGMIARPADGSRFVTDVYDGAPADKAGILVGDEILAVDGEPYHELDSFRGKEGGTAEVRLRRSPGAKPMTVEVQVRSLRPLQTFEKAIENSVSVTEHDGRQIGYVRLWTLAAPDAMDIVAHELADGRLKDADGLVLDLRGRWGGGRSDAAEMFVGDTPSFRLVPREGDDILANVRWRRPVVGIIDEGARSGLEVFAYALKTNGIPLVGERTAGALLAASAFLLPDDSLLILAVSDAVLEDGVRLEGSGVEPDIPVPFSLPYAAGNDPQRDAAIEEMRRILASNEAQRG